MFTSVNPATGASFATYAEIDDDALETALSDAHAAYRKWRVTPIAERVKLLNAIADQFDAYKEALAKTATLEMGKTFASAIAEVEKCALCFRHYAEKGPEYLKSAEVKIDQGRVVTHHLPLGVILAVMPWNFPYFQVVRWLAPTILAGNAGVLKHAANVQGCAAHVQMMLDNAGAPHGLFQNLRIKSGRVAGVIADKRIAAVTLTGSEGAGSKVAEVAGRELKKVVLELGGSDPFIVMPSADLDAVVEQAVQARVQNAGQSCICGKRMIVHADIYDAFRDKFIAAMAAVPVGDPMDSASRIGPLSSQDQLDTVTKQLAAAQASGATLHGGRVLKRPGAWIEPGVLTDIDPDSEVGQQEIFGPIAMLFKVADLDAAVELANNTPYGLGASVWTQDAAEIDRFVRDVESGMIGVNRLIGSTPPAPFGGIKLSGHGRELGPWGLHEFTNLKAEYRAD